MRNFGMTTPLVADGVIGQNKGRRPRRFPLQRGSTAHGMNVTGYTRRLVTIACVLGLGLTLGSCGGGFSGYVADHWPRWAGGMPSDVPPRPGAPGYDEFIAHGQADQMPPKSAAAGPAANAAPNQKPAAGAAQPVFQQVPAAPAAAANDQPAEDSSVVKGGLY